jgi:hypothetical protein
MRYILSIGESQFVQMPIVAERRKRRRERRSRGGDDQDGGNGEAHDAMASKESGSAD